MRADRKLGQWLKGHINHDGAKGLGSKVGYKNQLTSKDKVSLEDVKIDKQKSHLFQKMASLPDDKFEEIVEANFPLFVYRIISL